MSADSLHKVATGLMAAGLIGLLGFVVRVESQLSAIEVELRQSAEQSKQILAVLDTIAPRTITP
tara:strand:+ start:483 stop:674 length:192 start_codon:yes stop_codon:yes gene_type:complete